MSDPEKRRSAIVALLWMSPAAFLFGVVFVYLTEFKPTAANAAIAGASASLLTLGAATVLAIFQENANTAFRVIAVVVAVITIVIKSCSP